jgi:hypothetical protein
VGTVWLAGRYEYIFLFVEREVVVRSESRVMFLVVDWEFIYQDGSRILVIVYMQWYHIILHNEVVLWLQTI